MRIVTRIITQPIRASYHLNWWFGLQRHRFVSRKDGGMVVENIRAGEGNKQRLFISEIGSIAYTA